MNKLAVSLSSIPEQGLAIEAIVEEAELRPPDANELNVGPVSVAGTLEDVRGEYLFRGTVSGAHRRTCDRCLQPVEAPFSVEVLWVFREEAGDDEYAAAQDDEENTEECAPRVGGVEGGKLDLAPLTWEETVLAVPTKVVCREDCAGLCPGCGANLNQGACQCPEKTDGNQELGNTGLSRLAEMFPELKPDHGKE